MAAPTRIATGTWDLITKERYDAGETEVDGTLFISRNGEDDIADFDISFSKLVDSDRIQLSDEYDSSAAITTLKVQPTNLNMTW